MFEIGRFFDRTVRDRPFQVGVERAASSRPASAASGMIRCGAAPVAAAAATAPLRRDDVGIVADERRGIDDVELPRREHRSRDAARSPLVTVSRPARSLSPNVPVMRGEAVVLAALHQLRAQRDSRACCGITTPMMPSSSAMLRPRARICSGTSSISAMLGSVPDTSMTLFAAQARATSLFSPRFAVASGDSSCAVDAERRVAQRARAAHAHRLADPRVGRARCRRPRGRRARCIRGSR